jgi:Ca2+-binding EF-hand superfamily protein
MTARWALVALAIVTVSEPTLAANRAPANPDENLDAVWFHPDRPVFLRLQVRLDDRPYTSAWRQAVAHLFRHVDVDGDGSVTPEELGFSAWLDRMRSDAAVPAARDHRTLRNAEELAELIRPALPPLTLQAASSSADGAEQLFARLDRDGDHGLSKLELEMAAEELSVLDKDDDEMICPSELVREGSPLMRRGRAQPGPTDPASAPIVLISSYESRVRLAARLIKQYDRGSPTERDHKLARDELGIAAAPFANADADADGTLDCEELTRSLAHPAPDLAIAVNIGTRADARTTVNPLSANDLSPFLARRMRGTPSGQLELRDERVELEFSPHPLFANDEADVRRSYQAQIMFLDLDGSQTVDRQEAERDPFFLMHFTLMDRNGDGKLTPQELLTLLDLGLELAHGRVVVLVADEGHAFFDALDSDHDRRLSLRELRSAVGRLARWDGNHDGRLAESEIPQHLRVSFDHAAPAFSIYLGLTSTADSIPAIDQRNRPVWFAKLDVNHDGDLSPREFLGTADTFRRLDRDGDGLIDATEAARWEPPAP